MVFNVKHVFKFKPNGPMLCQAPTDCIWDRKSNGKLPKLQMQQQTETHDIYIMIGLFFTWFLPITFVPDQIRTRPKKHNPFHHSLEFSTWFMKCP